MKSKKYNLEKRKYVIGSVIVGIVLIYILRLFSLQIVSDEYKQHADSNAFLKKTQYPARGIIYDRNDSLLVYNQPAYDITFIPREIEKGLDTLDLCDALGITREYFDKRIKDLRNTPGYSRYTHQTLLTQLSGEEFSVFQEKLFRFPGFYIQRRSIRQYTCDVGAHVLGDIAEVSKRDMENDEYYKRGSLTALRLTRAKTCTFCVTLRITEARSLRMKWTISFELVKSNKILPNLFVSVTEGFPGGQLISLKMGSILAIFLFSLH